MSGEKSNETPSKGDGRANRFAVLVEPRQGGFRIDVLSPEVGRLGGVGRGEGTPTRPDWTSRFGGDFEVEGGWGGGYGEEEREGYAGPSRPIGAGTRFGVSGNGARRSGSVESGGRVGGSVWSPARLPDLVPYGSQTPRSSPRQPKGKGKGRQGPESNSGKRRRVVDSSDEDYADPETPTKRRKSGPATSLVRTPRTRSVARAAAAASTPSRTPRHALRTEEYILAHYPGAIRAMPECSRCTKDGFKCFILPTTPGKRQKYKCLTCSTDACPFYTRPKGRQTRKAGGESDDEDGDPSKGGDEEEEEWKGIVGGDWEEESNDGLGPSVGEGAEAGEEEDEDDWRPSGRGSESAIGEEEDGRAGEEDGDEVGWGVFFRCAREAWDLPDGSRLRECLLATMGQWLDRKGLKPSDPEILERGRRWKENGMRVDDRGGDGYWDVDGDWDFDGSGYSGSLRSSDLESDSSLESSYPRLSVEESTTILRPTRRIFAHAIRYPRGSWIRERLVRRMRREFRKTGRELEESAPRFAGEGLLGEGDDSEREEEEEEEEEEPVSHRTRIASHRMDALALDLIARARLMDRSNPKRYSAVRIAREHFLKKGLDFDALVEGFEGEGLPEEGDDSGEDGGSDDSGEDGEE